MNTPIEISSLSEYIDLVDGITDSNRAKDNIRVALEKIGISEKTLFSDLLGFFERNTYM